MSSTVLQNANAVSQSSAVMHERIAAVFDKQIFFVVGCQKSGTTWVQRLLDGHPHICCRGEAAFGPVFVPILKNLLEQYNAQQQYRNAQLGPVEEHNLMGEFLLEYLFANCTAMMMDAWLTDQDRQAVQCIGEKTPEHAMYLPLLQKVFPNMKVIHIIRDGRDVAVSGWYHNLRFNQEKFQQQFPTMSRYVQYLLEHHWLPYIQQAQAFGRSHPQQYCEIRYEQLHAEPEATVNQLLTFLDVSAESEFVERCCSAGSFKKLAQGRDEGEENRQSFFRKGVVGDWRSTLDEQAVRTFMQFGGKMLKELGYAADEVQP